jgi:hypothetical protein
MRIRTWNYTNLLEQDRHPENTLKGLCQERYTLGKRMKSLEAVAAEKAAGTPEKQKAGDAVLSCSRWCSVPGPKYWARFLQTSCLWKCVSQ